MRVVRDDVTAGWFITVTDEYGGVHEVHPLNGVGSWGSQADAMLAWLEPGESVEPVPVLGFVATLAWDPLGEFSEQLEWALYDRWGDHTPGSVRLAEVTTIADRWPHLAGVVGRVEILPSTAEEDVVCQRRYGCTPAELIARMGGE